MCTYVCVLALCYCFNLLDSDFSDSIFIPIYYYHLSNLGGGGVFLSSTFWYQTIKYLQIYRSRFIIYRKNITDYSYFYGALFQINLTDNRNRNITAHAKLIFWSIKVYNYSYLLLLHFDLFDVSGFENYWTHVKVLKSQKIYSLRIMASTTGLISVWELP